ncbi:MAG: tetratricopeptide repeat protein [Ignavibacteriae bacterium]|nr:tetratricopeptide repeat protein [Ignavibacteriota bacterium]
MLQQNQLRIFISSTFQDLQGEREHLVKKIFPEIRALCRERGVTFTDIDLRWGLTEEEASLGRIIRTCLEEVDKCRPYFIGILGNRYGWIPQLHQILMDPDLLSRYPWVEEYAMLGTSVTEMEFLHGVFSGEDTPTTYALFYHQPGDPTEADNPEKLQTLIERARETSHPFREFTDIEMLGKLVRDDLLRLIDEFWPERETPSELEIERRAHSAFATSRVRAYIPNPVHLKTFNTWVAQSSSPLVIQGESGLGKSSLTAYLAGYFRKKNPTAFVVEHYIGASEQSGSGVQVIRHIIAEVCDRFGIEEEPARSEAELIRTFPDWLFRAEHLAAEAGIPVLIIIDALNQVGGDSSRLGWLPGIIPSGIRLMVSITPGVPYDILSERGWEELKVLPLEDEEIRQSIVVRYLGEFHKGISPHQLRLLITDKKASSPLYLRVVAEELRLHGVHETLDILIKRYTDADDLHKVFERFLERMEKDHGVDVVRDVMSLIGISQSGLDESELLAMTDLSRLDLSRLLFALDYHLIRRDGLLGFFHDYLRLAVEKRYLGEESIRKELHLKIAGYLNGIIEVAVQQGEPINRRTASECAWQLARTGEQQWLCDYLATIPVFFVLFKGSTKFDFLNYWSALSATYNIEEVYRNAMEGWESEITSSERVAVYHELIQMLQLVGQIEEAMEMGQKSLRAAIESGDRKLIAEVRLGIGISYSRLGQYQNALDELYRSLDLFVELGLPHGESPTLGTLGIVYSHLGKFDKALEYLKRQEAICLEEGDRIQHAQALASIGHIHNVQGEFEKAQACFQEQALIGREVGNRSTEAIAHLKLGALSIDQEDYTRALKHLNTAREISRNIGALLELSYAIGNIGLIHKTVGRLDEALECYQEQTTVCRKLGDRHNMITAIGNTGFVYLEREEYEEACEHLHSAIEGHREIGARNHLIVWYNGMSTTLLELALNSSEMPGYLTRFVEGIDSKNWRETTLAAARTAITESLAIAKELHDPQMIFEGELVDIHIDVAEGKIREAKERLKAMHADAASSNQRGDLHYWLWKLEDESDDHATKAYHYYNEVFESSPINAYRIRIAELSAYISSEQDP